MNKTRISTTKIAEICGVSQGTVDRALNGRKGISLETKEKILNVAKEHGYRPNIHVSQQTASMRKGHFHVDLHRFLCYNIKRSHHGCAVFCTEAIPHCRSFT